jgi:hypothetical protein
LWSWCLVDSVFGMTTTSYTNDFGQWPTRAAYQQAYNAAKTNPDRLRAFYHLPPWVKRGCRVIDQYGTPGVITGFHHGQMYVFVLLEGAGRSDAYHPLDLRYPATNPRELVAA